jgi:hypothetical protein
MSWHRRYFGQGETPHRRDLSIKSTEKGWEFTIVDRVNGAALGLRLDDEQVGNMVDFVRGDPGTTMKWEDVRGT